MAKPVKEGGLHTYIFLDIDGVLNVGVRDPSGGAPLLFSENNVLHAQRLAQSTPLPRDKENVEKLLSIDVRKLGHGEGGAYSSLAARGNVQTVPLLVERFARLIRAAGPRCEVVLCSSWRLPKHPGPVKRLEQEISSYLGEDFAFKEKTPCREDSTPAERLRCIGDYIHDLGTPSRGDSLRMLVLDDLFVSDMRDLRLGCTRIDSVEGAERYLRGRSQDPERVSVRLVKPFDEWVTQTGHQVQIGAGLTMEHFCHAMLFLGADAGCGCCCAVKGQRRSSVVISDASTTDEETPPKSSPKEKTLPKAAAQTKEAPTTEDAASKGPADKKAATRRVQAAAWLMAASLRRKASLPRISLLAPKRGL